MTLAATTPTPAAPPITQEPTDIPLPHGSTTPFLYISDDATEFTLSVREACPECDSEGRRLVMTGSRWSNAQGGMWVPDEHEVPCDECHGNGYRTRTRCVRCGHLHQNDQWGIAKGETECMCDPDDVAQAIVAHTRLMGSLDALAQAVQDLKAHGVTPLVSVHYLPWNAFLTVAAEREARIRSVTRADGSRSYDAGFDGITVFSDRKEA